jgi:hypothetical protein
MTAARIPPAHESPTKIASSQWEILRIVVVEAVRVGQPRGNDDGFADR